MFKKIYLFGFNYQFVVDNLFYCLSWNEDDFEYRVNVTKRLFRGRGEIFLNCCCGARYARSAAT